MNAKLKNLVEELDELYFIVNHHTQDYYDDCSHRVGYYEDIEEALEAAVNAQECKYDRETGWYYYEDHADLNVDIEMVALPKDNGDPIRIQRTLRSWLKHLEKR